MADARYVPGQAIVRFRDDVSLAAATRLATDNGARVTDLLPRAPGGGRTAVVSSASLSTAELIDELRADPRVDRAEPDYLLHLDATPNDPDLPSLWGMTQIRMPGAWDLSTGSSSVVLASLDTGVDYTHPDLAANMWHNPGEIAGNGLDDDGNGYVDDIYGIASASDAVDPSDPMDVQGHGTHTAGTMAGVGDNGTGVAGVAWHASIMALRFFDASGLGATSDAIACIDYVITMKERGVNVVAINASWGSSENSAFLRWAIEAAGDAGIIVVAAAGNGGGDKIGDDNDTVPYYPASYDCANIIAVAASDAADALTEFSNYGAASVDLVAPGIDIWSTVPTAMVPAGYAFKKGTSMAAPHVTGTIALCAALYPGRDRRRAHRPGARQRGPGREPRGQVRDRRTARRPRGARHGGAGHHGGGSGRRLAQRAGDDHLCRRRCGLQGRLHRVQPRRRRLRARGKLRGERRRRARARVPRGGQRR